MLHHYLFIIISNWNCKVNIPKTASVWFQPQEVEITFEPFNLSIIIGVDEYLISLFFNPNPNFPHILLPNVYKLPSSDYPKIWLIEYK